MDQLLVQQVDHDAFSLHHLDFRDGRAFAFFFLRNRGPVLPIVFELLLLVLGDRLIVEPSPLRQEGAEGDTPALRGPTPGVLLLVFFVLLGVCCLSFFLVPLLLLREQGSAARALPVDRRCYAVTLGYGRSHSSEGQLLPQPLRFCYQNTDCCLTQGVNFAP